MATTRVREIPRWILATTFGLSILAVGLTAYLTVTHYTDPTALACPDTGIINCTAVTTSSWSAIFGVPVALVGLLWALGMVALNSPWAWHAQTQVRTRTQIRAARLSAARLSAARLSAARLALSGAGAAMVLYLVYVELFRVDAICLWCTGVHITAVALFAAILAARVSLNPEGRRAASAAAYSEM
jgi:uncharacterized membrane protein